ncbi:MAG: deoxyribose-phosphate aldolase [Planctomycetes bacterium]|nr:deoxyribose-phosphate aldolase [Planctomycetota bacterium]
MNGIDLASFLDHSVLRPDTRLHDIDTACDAALLYRFRGVVVPSGAVHHAKRRLMNTGIKVVATVAFPHGNQAPDVKANEAMRAAALGADEIDYVISIGAALDDDLKYLREEALAIIRQTRGKIVKAILEVGYLGEKQRFESARALAATGIPYVKTCTGFGPGGARAEDVALLCQAVNGKALVKASGGIRTREQVLEMLQAGAAVVGTSHSAEICAGT